MKCNLTSLIDALKLEFPLETCGDMALQISDLQGLTPDNPPTRPDVLYTIEQNQLLREAHRFPGLLFYISISHIPCAKTIALSQDSVLK